MSQTSENERAEQIWSGWSKFGVGGANLEWVEGADVGRTVWRIADNLEETLLCKFLFSWAKFLKLDTYIYWFLCEIYYRALEDGANVKTCDDKSEGKTSFIVLKP